MQLEIRSASANYFKKQTLVLSKIKGMLWEADRVRISRMSGRKGILPPGTTLTSITPNNNSKIQFHNTKMTLRSYLL